MSGYARVELTCEFVKETEKAICVEVGDIPFREQIWLPKSQLKGCYLAEAGDEIDINMPRWLAEEKELTEWTH